MLVWITYRKAFDRAVTDRVDEVVELDLPQKAERAHLIDQYFAQYVVGGNTALMGSSMEALVHGALCLQPISISTVKLFRVGFKAFRDARLQSFVALSRFNAHHC